MTKTELRNMHSKFQRDVAIFDNQKKIKSGRCNGGSSSVRW